MRSKECVLTVTILLLLEPREHHLGSWNIIWLGLGAVRGRGGQQLLPDIQLTIDTSSTHKHSIVHNKPYICHYKLIVTNKYNGNTLKPLGPNGRLYTECTWKYCNLYMKYCTLWSLQLGYIMWLLFITFLRTECNNNAIYIICTQ